MRICLILALFTGCSGSEAEKFPNSHLNGEGEGEISAEGEGEENPPITAEGEGETSEGEGEIPSEGEGELPDGEGEGEDENPPCECEEDDDCSDQNACNGEETCVQCLCNPGNPPTCTDEVDCTDEQCDPEEGCIITPVHARCPDGEICKKEEGCAAPPPCRGNEDCVPEDVCQVGHCDDSSRTCVYEPFDGDLDEHPPRVCGGQDCDDSNADIYPEAPELCNELDDDCDGLVDEDFDLEENENHCGACDNACNSGVGCAQGQCNHCIRDDATLCPQDDDEVACILTDTDEENCGGCGIPCPEDTECRNARCVCTQANQILCDWQCVSSNSVDNCGECGALCPDNQNCSDGQCNCRFVTENNQNCGGNCLYCNNECIKNDAANCGECGWSCPEGAECEGFQQCGACRRYFRGRNNDPGFCVGNECIVCNDQCIHPMIDDQNCGECGNRCTGNTTCRNSVCSCLDVDAPDLCDGTCVNLLSNDDNCGECENRCPDDQNCVDGACECPEAESICPDGCANLSNDPQNCGECGNSCPEGATCVDGTCACQTYRNGDQWNACNGDCLICDNTCINTIDNQLHCGDCNNQCPDGAECWFDECECDLGEDPDICDDECVDLWVDPQNCGECGNICPGAVDCTMGRCECSRLESQCPDGCKDLSDDPQNCGECGNVCAGTEECLDEQCACVTFLWHGLDFGCDPSAQCETCNNQCVSFTRDKQNCGECGNACEQNQKCADGQCVACDAEGGIGIFTLCDGACKNTLLDTNHCGDCNNACQEAEVCINSACQ